MQHHVYFWLKEEYANSESKVEFEKALDKLSAIPHITQGGWGKPAATEKRPVIDDSYSYCSYSTFTSISEHDKYQDHPDHLEFITKYKDWWARALIMDVE